MSTQKRQSRYRADSYPDGRRGSLVGIFDTFDDAADALELHGHPHPSGPPATEDTPHGRITEFFSPSGEWTDPETQIWWTLYRQ